MRIGKDGKPFDIDTFGGSLASDEVEVIQSLKPDGRRRRLAAKVGEEIARMADKLILSAEEMRDGEVAIYARKMGDKTGKEEIMLARNGPGEQSPTNVLKKLMLYSLKATWVHYSPPPSSKPTKGAKKST